MTLNHCVEIRPVENNSGFENISDIGMFGGVIRWVTAYDESGVGFNSSNSSDKFLAENWLGTLSKSATVTRGGNYASIGGGTVKVVSTKFLLKWLADYKISLYNAVITILESDDEGLNYTPIRTGIISQHQDNLKNSTIPFSDMSKSTATTITNEIGESGKFYPVNFGRLPNAKTVSVKASGDIPTTVADGLVAVWEVYDIKWDEWGSEGVVSRFNVRTPYINGVEPQDQQNFFLALRYMIDGMGVKQGDIILPVDGIAVFETYSTIILKHGTAKTTELGGIVPSTGVDTYVQFVPFGINAYDDYFEGERVSNNLTNYDTDKDEFVALPYIRDAEDLEQGKTHLTDSDSKGYSEIQVRPFYLDSYTTARGTPEFPVVTGNIANTFDGSSLTETKVEISNNPQHSIAIRHGVIVNPTTKPTSDVLLTFDMDVDLHTVPVPSHSFAPSVTVNVFCIAKDFFGNTYELPATFNMFSKTYSSGTQGIPTSFVGVMSNSCNYLKYNGGSDRTWKWDTTSEYGKSGIGMVADFSKINKMVWEAGFELDIRFEIKSNANELFGDTLQRGTITCRQIQLLEKKDFKSDAIFTDINGRKDQDGTTLTTLADVYKHTLKLQNYSNRDYEGAKLPTPVDGWGINYPAVTDWSTFYSNADFAQFDESAIFQIMSDKNARTDKIKADICRLLWAIGYTDKNGVERFKSMVDGLYNTNGTLITYGDLFEGELPKNTDRKYSDVFTDAMFIWGYHTATEKELNRLTVDTSTAGVLGDLARVLHNSYKIINKTPAQITDCRYFSELEDVEGYALNFYNWQGAYEYEGSAKARKRYSSKIKLPYEFARANGLDEASSIQLQIPNITYFGSTPSNHSGIITAIQESVSGSAPMVEITAEMLGDDLAGIDRIIYTETGTAETQIIETGTQNTQIIEG
ncbi:MAG: hypothetical protein U9N61_01605 [Euryarchaeota archaeon]|nr:hypothetical protein [Euryarchaeota archaeon]